MKIMIVISDPEGEDQPLDRLLSILGNQDSRDYLKFAITARDGQFRAIIETDGK